MIDTVFSLRDFVLKLIEKYENSYTGSLDEYLRSIWTSIGQHRDEKPSYDLFGQILEEGFRVPPSPFNPEWLKITEPPSKPPKYYGVSIDEFPVETPRIWERYGGLSDFTFLERTVHSLMAELHRFSEKKPEDYGRYEKYARDYKYYGLESPTGHTWYNWDPFTFLECATAGMLGLFESLKRRGKSLSNPTWVTFAHLLDYGRSYE